MARALILGCAGPELGSDEARFLRDADPWGFILFARNVVSPDQVRRLTSSLREAVGRQAPVLVDQEGGRVQRLGPPFWTRWPRPLTQMSRAEDPERAMFLRATLIARELRDVGIDVNCTPTADIAGEHTHPFLLSRLYGHSVATVAARARANADGCLQGGVLPVLKHIPGHGRANADSHLRLPRVSAALSDLRETDFAVFRALADLPLGMSAHVIYEALDPDRPGTVSPAVIREVRDGIGFGGLLMTDDLSMNALPGSVAERARRALAAGCDVVLHCNGDRAEMAAVAAECPALAGAALEQADRALAMRAPPVEIDVEAARDELAGLSAA